MLICLRCALRGLIVPVVNFPRGWNCLVCGTHGHRPL